MKILLPSGHIENSTVNVNQLRTRILVYLMYIIGGATYYLLPIWAKVFFEDFGFSNQQIGLITSADMTSTALAAFLGRYWIDKIYWRKVMPLVLVLTAIANVLCIFTEDFGFLLTLRYITGFGAGSIAVFTYGIISSSNKPDREFAFAAATSVTTGIVLLNISPIIINQWGGSVTFIPLVIIVLLPLLFINALPTVNPIDHSIDNTIVIDDTKTSSNYAILFGLLMACLFVAATSSIWTFAESIGNAEGYDLPFISFVLSLVVVFDFMGFFVSGLIAGRINRLTLISCSYLLMFVVAYFLGNHPTAIIFAVALCSYNFLTCLVTPVQNGWIASMDNTGKKVILIPVAQSFGVALGPLLAGMVITGTQYSSIAYLSIMLLVLALVSAFCMSRAEKIPASRQRTAAIG